MYFFLSVQYNLIPITKKIFWRFRVLPKCSNKIVVNRIMQTINDGNYLYFS